MSAASLIVAISRATRPSMPGRSTLTATSRPSVNRARWAWAREAAATGSSNLANNSSSGLPSALSTSSRATSVGKRRQAVLEMRQIVGEGLTEDVSAGGEELAKLDAHRSQPHQSLGQAALQAGHRALRGRRRAAKPARQASTKGKAADRSLLATGRRRGPGSRRPSPAEARMTASSPDQIAQP